MEAAKVRPILFSTEMVKAILDGRKTQTRRLVKFPKDFTGEVYNNSPYGLKYSSNLYVDTIQRLAYALPDDILWVREKWRKNDVPTGFPFHHYADNTIYTDRDNEKWKPSLFMPKEACRLFLKVKSVGVERLQDISHEDAEYQAEMEYYAYLDKLIEDKQYQLHAVEIALDMLNSKEFANSGLSAKDYLDAERKRLAVKSLNDSTKSF